MIVVRTDSPYFFKEIPMSWDISIITNKCEACGRYDGEVFDVNYTSNVYPMLREASFDWDDIEGKSCQEALPIVQELLDKMEVDPEKFRKLNPVNGWGDFDRFYQVLESFKKALQGNEGIVRISR